MYCAQMCVYSQKLVCKGMGVTSSLMKIILDL